jgi:hypothetical protein
MCSRRLCLGETETHCCHSAIVTTPFLSRSHCYDPILITIPLLQSHSCHDPIVTIPFLSRSHYYDPILMTIPLLRTRYHNPKDTTFDNLHNKKCRHLFFSISLGSKHSPQHSLSKHTQSISCLRVGSCNLLVPR